MKRAPNNWWTSYFIGILIPWHFAEGGTVFKEVNADWSNGCRFSLVSPVERYESCARRLQAFSGDMAARRASSLSNLLKQAHKLIGGRVRTQNTEFLAGCFAFATLNRYLLHFQAPIFRAVSTTQPPNLASSPEVWIWIVSCLLSFQTPTLLIFICFLQVVNQEKQVGVITLYEPSGINSIHVIEMGGVSMFRSLLLLLNVYSCFLSLDSSGFWSQCRETADLLSPIGELVMEVVNTSGRSPIPRVMIDPSCSSSNFCDTSVLAHIFRLIDWSVLSAAVTIPGFFLMTFKASLSALHSGLKIRWNGAYFATVLYWVFFQVTKFSLALH